MKRYKYTITLGVVLVVIVGVLMWRAGEASECKARGGVYVQTFTGWACVR